VNEGQKPNQKRLKAGISFNSASFYKGDKEFSFRPPIHEEDNDDDAAERALQSHYRSNPYGAT
jgi:hypothetical protein